MAPDDATSDGVPHHSLLARAAEWLARRDAGWTAADRAEFEQWLAADARHAAAWEELESAWVTFDHPRQRGLADEMVSELALRRRRRQARWRFAGCGLAVAAGIACLVAFLPSRPAPSAAPVASGVLLRPDVRDLPDGSRIDLNAGAEVEVKFSAEVRAIRLVRGEAHFNVARNPERPFVVTAGALAVRAVGTAFSMKLETHTVDLLVTEGRVAVGRAGDDSVPPAPAASDATPANAFVDAGGHLTVSMSGPAAPALEARPIDPVEMERRLAWRGPRLELSGTPLGEAAAILNRENRVRIVVRDPALREMRLSGVFRADDPEGFVRLLETHYGVAVQRRTAEEFHLVSGR